MATEGEAARWSDAIVLIHGIGDQGRGEQIDLYTEQLLRSPSFSTSRRDPPPDTDSIVYRALRCDDRSVLLVEAHWADIFDRTDEPNSAPNPDNYFSVWDVMAAAWLPVFNWWQRAYGSRWKFKKALFSLLLVPLSMLVAPVSYALYDLDRRFRSDDHLLFHRAMDKPRDPKIPAPDAANALKGPVALWLDRKVGDVFTYAAQLSSEERYDMAERVHREVRSSAEAARSAADRVSILAHSLGSVIGYRAIGQRDLGDIENLWTIGSPLDKFALLWPGLVGGQNLSANVQRWRNFTFPLDAVSGRLDAFSERPTNHILWRSRLRAHSNYLADGVVPAYIAFDLTRNTSHVERLERRRPALLALLALLGNVLSVFWLLLRAVVLMAVALVLILAACAFTAVVFSLIVYGVGYLVGYPFGYIPGVDRGIAQTVAAAVTAVGLLYLVFGIPILRARNWSKASAQRDPQPPDSV